MLSNLLRCLLLIATYLVTVAVSVAQNAPMQKQVVQLNSGWEFRQVVDAATPVSSAPAVEAKAASGEAGQWRPAVVPGCIHLDLLRNKLIPDPFYRDNEAKLQWIETADWEYRTTLQASPALLKQRNVELVFEGLDAYSHVYLNGKLILTANNMFRTWRVGIKDSLTAGANELRVVFPSPIRAAAMIAAADSWREKTQVEEKTYVRKAAYEYGWDWGPRFVTSGIWRPVRLEAWDLSRISNVHIRQLDVGPAVAHLVAEVEVTAVEDVTANVGLEYSHAGKKYSSARDVQLHAGANNVQFPIDLARPALWYPAGYGAQPIYRFNAHVRVVKRLQDQATAQTGLRSVVLRREPDQWGRSFEFVINGVPVFAKGADVIPFDSFSTRITTAGYRHILQSAVDANMNMIRHWGGGYYETDEFYDLCDELGIMVWQDFMFGNDWQPGAYFWKLNVAQEAEDQLRRLRDHPSIIIWCGNNETEIALAWKDRTKLPSDVRVRMWQDYLTTFSGMLATAVSRLTPETPYWPSSPSADYEETSEGYQSGDMHDWSVWHGRAPFSDYEKHNPRFMTEFGFQSFPEMRTIEAFTDPQDRTSIFTPVMLSHQKNEEGNELIKIYMLRDYPQPKDFASFLYVSQVLQAEGIKLGAEHLRRNRPRTMGSIYWQLNDCWPVASWSSIDYYGRWKALQYYARRFYAPLLVSPHVENGNLAIYIVSDKTTPTSASLRVRFMTLDGKLLSDKTQEVQIAPLSSRIVQQPPMLDIMSMSPDLGKVFVATDLIVGDEAVSSNLLPFVATKDFHLPPAQITAVLAKSNVGNSVQLSSPVLARDVYVSFGNLDVKLSDNYLTLLPGESRAVRIESASPLEQLQANMKVMSLIDAFAPATASEPALVVPAKPPSN